jgi:hypothetical protein
VFLLHRLGDDAHRVGKVCYNNDAWRAVTYDEHIVSACTHYVSITFFRFAGATLQLLLGRKNRTASPHRSPPVARAVLSFLFVLRRPLVGITLRLPLCLRGISGWIVDSYRPHCYIKPCELEDEALGTTFSFFQGTYMFSSEGCRGLYMAKKTPSPPLLLVS